MDLLQAKQAPHGEGKQLKKNKWRRCVFCSSSFSTTFSWESVINKSLILRSTICFLHVPPTGQLFCSQLKGIFQNLHGEAEHFKQKNLDVSEPGCCGASPDCSTRDAIVSDSSPYRVCHILMKCSERRWQKNQNLHSVNETEMYLLCFSAPSQKTNTFSYTLQSLTSRLLLIHSANFWSPNLTILISRCPLTNLKIPYCKWTTSHLHRSPSKPYPELELLTHRKTKTTLLKLFFSKVIRDKK